MNFLEAILLLDTPDIRATQRRADARHNQEAAELHARHARSHVELAERSFSESAVDYFRREALAYQRMSAQLYERAAALRDGESQ